MRQPPTYPYPLPLPTPWGYPWWWSGGCGDSGCSEGCGGSGGCGTLATLTALTTLTGGTMVRRRPAKELVRNEMGGFTADQVTPEAPKWLAAPVGGPVRFPVGALVFFNGEGGHGKSMVTCHLASAVTRGEAWPDGGKSTSRPGNVLMFNKDDSIKVNIVNRLNAVGTDLTKVHFLTDAMALAGFKRPLYLPGKNDADLDFLIKYIVRYKIKLVVIDPAAVYFRIGPGVRARVLDKLMDAAEQHAFTVLLVRHIPGYKNDVDGDRGAGGYEFGTACRAGYDVIPDVVFNTHKKDDTERFVLRTIKNSYAAKAKARAYKTYLSPNPAHLGATYIEFEKEPITFEQITAMLKWQDQQSPKSQAEAWLNTQLLAAGADGILRAELMTEAKRAEVAVSTLDRLAKDPQKVVKRVMGGQVDGRPTKISRWYHPQYAPVSP